MGTRERISKKEAAIQVDCFASQYGECHPRSALKVSAIEIDDPPTTIDLTFEVLPGNLGKRKSARPEAEKFVRDLKSEESSDIAKLAVRFRLVGEPDAAVRLPEPAPPMASEALEIIERYFAEHGDDIDEPVSVCDTRLSRDAQKVVIAFLAMPGLEVALAQKGAEKVWERIRSKHPELASTAVELSVEPEPE